MAHTLSRKNRVLSIIVILVSMFMLRTTAYAAEDDLPRGRLIEKVAARGDLSHSYALYLPSYYAAVRKFPVLYCFDPAARGRLPVELFREAAERYGYIVVGSNNSRNGPDVPLDQIVKTLWDDTHDRLSVDERRIYTAGFSGGARLALALAYRLKGLIAGVIACSGGAPYRGDGPLAQPSFVLFGTAGVEDFNNPEMQSLARSFAESSVRHRLAIFEGGHEWPPAPLCAEAVEWLEVEAMRAGLKQRDESLLTALFNKAREKARQDEATPNLYRAYMNYTALVRDFRGLKPTGDFESKVAELSVRKEVRQALKQEKDLEKEQKRDWLALRTLIESVKRSENRLQASSELKSAILDLKKSAASERSSTEQIVARRLVALLFVNSFEQGSAAISQKQYEAAILHFSIGTQIQPDNPRVFYHLARAYALAGDGKKALGALQSAVEKGFSDEAALKAKEFEALQNEDRFKDISDSVRKNRKQ